MSWTNRIIIVIIIVMAVGLRYDNGLATVTITTVAVVPAMHTFHVHLLTPICNKTIGNRRHQTPPRGLVLPPASQSELTPELSCPCLANIGQTKPEVHNVSLPEIGGKGGRSLLTRCPFLALSSLS